MYCPRCKRKAELGISPWVDSETKIKYKLKNVAPNYCDLCGFPIKVLHGDLLKESSSPVITLPDETNPDEYFDAIPMLFTKKPIMTIKDIPEELFI